MPKVTFVNEKRTIEVPEGACLRTEALNNGIQVHEWPHQGILNCHGFGSCATCSVEIVRRSRKRQPPGPPRMLRFLTGRLRSSCESAAKRACVWPVSAGVNGEL